MRVLYQFPLSHYCEKARWLLDHKGLDYVAQNLTPGPHRIKTQLKTKQNLLPMLHDGRHWVADSTQIALYLDLHYPEHSLLRRDPTLRQQALDIDLFAGRLGNHVRRWSLAHSLSVGDEPIEIMMGEKGYLRQFEKLTKPLLKKMVQQGYQLQPEKVAHSQTTMQGMIETLNHMLIQADGRYFVGDRLGLADIAVCAMLAPIVHPTGTPWEIEEGTLLPSSMADYKAHFLSLPLGQYVQRIYQNERNASVDWRGI